MKIVNLYSILIILVLAEYHGSKSETIQDFLEMLRNKVRNLEATHQITRDYKPYKQSKVENNEKFDFIIVGAGSAGSALIRRLSEVPEWKILVLEAGGEPDILTDIPFWSMMLQATNLDWGYFTEKEENVALGFEHQRMHWIQGKGLGGTSLLNGMIFSRGARQDYDRWGSLGNPGWFYEDVLPYFKKIETCEIKNQEAELRGHKGPVFVETPYISRAGDVFLQAAKNAGYKNIDYNGRQHLGVSHFQSSLKRGLRCSGERCYIKPVKNRKNLTISLQSQVTKILFNGKVATGVEYYKNGKIYQAFARKEVILSAGVIRSPHILLLSGIGPKKELEKFDIKQTVELPVGQKLYDHPLYFGLGFTLNETLQVEAGPALEDEAFINLYNEGRGILTDTGTGDSLLFLKTSLAETNVADIEFILWASHFSQDFEKGQANSARLSRKLYDKIYRKYEGHNTISLGVILLHPESYGHLELKSANPFDYPKLFGGYFTDANGKDIKTLTAGIREAIKLMQLPPFDKYDIKRMDDTIPGCENFEHESDAYWECALRTLTTTIYHQIATCKMGPVDDSEAVVDSRLKVHGVDRLRVVDNSVIPLTITGHMNVPAFLVGEKAADMIKEDNINKNVRD